MTSMEQEKRFDILVVALREAGYRVRVGFSHGESDGGSYKYRNAFVDGKNVEGMFAPVNEWSYPYCSGRICADHADCYDKPSKCPLVMRLPRDEAQARAIVRWLGKLGTKQGFEASNTYEYLNENPFPYQMGDA